MSIGRLQRTVCALLLLSACGTSANLPAPGPLPAANSITASPACEETVLALAPLIVDAAAPPEPANRELWVDISSFAAGAVLFCGAPVDPQKVARAIHRPFRDASGRGMVPEGNAGHLRLQSLVPVGMYYVETIVRVSSTRSSGQRDLMQVRLTFRRNGDTFELVEREGLSTT